MLIGEPKQVIFDFHADYSESMATLENEILFTSGRARYPINEFEPTADLLIELLHNQIIEVSYQEYSFAEETAEYDNPRIRQAVNLTKKRNTGAIPHALHVYKNCEPSERHNRYNAIYYSSMRTYVRIGDTVSTQVD